MAQFARLGGGMEIQIIEQNDLIICLEKLSPEIARITCTNNGKGESLNFNLSKDFIPKFESRIEQEESAYRYLKCTVKKDGTCNISTYHFICTVTMLYKTR